MQHNPFLSQKWGWEAPARPGIKRKSLITPETVPEPPPPAKHFITEEMTAEMHRLQLGEQVHCLPVVPTPNSVTFSQDYMPVPFNSDGQFHGFGNQCFGVPQSNFLINHSYQTNVPFQNADAFSENPQEMEAERDQPAVDENSMPRLHISEDVLKIKPQPILPETLITDMVDRQSMALVPYMPLRIPIQDPEPPDENQDDIEMVN